MPPFFKPLCRLSAPARPKKSFHPVRDETISHSKKDICLYKDTPQIPAGSSNYRIRSWIASRSRSILIRYQSIPPYRRYANELFPEFRKERIPVARFLCRLLRLTFSLLPTQLAPYCQYTLAAIIGALLLGLDSRQEGEQGFQGAVLAVDPDSLVTPWLVACWLVLVRSGLQRAHAVFKKRVKSLFLTSSVPI